MATCNDFSFNFNLNVLRSDKKLSGSLGAKLKGTIKFGIKGNRKISYTVRRVSFHICHRRCFRAFENGNFTITSRVSNRVRESCIRIFFWDAISFSMMFTLVNGLVRMKGIFSSASVLEEQAIKRDAETCLGTDQGCGGSCSRSSELPSRRTSSIRIRVC